MTMDQILTIIAKHGSKYQYLLYSQRSNSIIDSPDSRVQGAVSMVEIKWAIDSFSNRIAKRMVDIIMAGIFIVFCPLLIWFIDNKRGWIINILHALIGKATWVGYDLAGKRSLRLPRLKPSVLAINNTGQQAESDNIAYARDYSIFKDLQVIIDKFEFLGNKVNWNAES